MHCVPAILLLLPFDSICPGKNKNNQIADINSTGASSSKPRQENFGRGFHAVSTTSPQENMIPCASFPLLKNIKIIRKPKLTRLSLEAFPMFCSCEAARAPARSPRWGDDTTLLAWLMSLAEEFHGNNTFPHASN